MDSIILLLLLFVAISFTPAMSSIEFESLVDPVIPKHLNFKDDYKNNMFGYFSYSS